MLSFFPRGVLDEILNLIESVSEGFLPTLRCGALLFMVILVLNKIIKIAKNSCLMLD